MKKLLLSFVAIMSCLCANADVYQKFTSELVEGDYVIAYDGKAMKAAISSNRFGYETIEKDASELEDPNASIIWHIAKQGDYVTLYNEAANMYATSNGTKNQGALKSDLSSFALWTATMKDGLFEFVNFYNDSIKVNKNLRNNTTYGFACYSTSTGGALTLYKRVENISPSGVAAPRIRPASGKYYEPQVVTFTSDYQVYYSINSETNFQLYDPIIMSVRLNDPGVYVVRAYAQDGEKKSDVAMNTIEIATLPAYTTFADAKADATTTSAPCKFTFDNVVVTGASASNAYLQDAAGNVAIIYNSNHGFTQGQTISGTVNLNFQLYYGALEFTNITKDTEGLTLGTGEPKATVMAVEDVGPVHYGKLITIENVTYAGGKFSQTTDDTYYITPYTTFMKPLPEFLEGKNYNITGIALYYTSNDVTTIEISPRSEADIKLLSSQKEQVITADYETALQVKEQNIYGVSCTGTGAISVESSDTDVATATYADGGVTVMALSKGETTITIKAAENEDYLPASLSYVLKVTNAGEYEALWVAKDQEDYANAVALDTTKVYQADANIGLSFRHNGNSNVPKYYTTGTGLRMYGDNTMTITAAKGYAVKEIKITYTAASYNGKFTADKGECNTDSVDYQIWKDASGKAYSDVTLTCNKTCRILTVNVVYVAQSGKDVVPGDANCDGQVSVADLALMASSILGESVDIDKDNADVNGDGDVTVADLAAVASMILNGDTPMAFSHPIVGEWSGVREVTSPVTDVRIHYNFKDDCTYEQIMEAWAQKRIGKYSVNGNTINMEVTSLEWLWDRDNGYNGVYDEAGVKDFAEWKATNPDEATYTMTYSFEKDGTLRLQGGPFGLDLIYVKNPGYQPQKHLW